MFISFCCESFDFSPRPVIKPCLVSRNILRPLLYYLRVKGDSQNDGQVMPDGGYQCFRPYLMLKEIRSCVRVHALYSRGDVSSAMCVLSHVFVCDGSSAKHSGPVPSCPSSLSPPDLPGTTRLPFYVPSCYPSRDLYPSQDLNSRPLSIETQSVTYLRLVKCFNKLCGFFALPMRTRVPFAAMVM